MGKAKKIGKLGSKVARSAPLGDEMELDGFAQPSGRIKVRKERHDGDDEFVGGKMGRGILKQSLAQLRELEDEDMPADADKDTSQHKLQRGPARVSLGASVVGNSDESDDDSDDIGVDEKETAVPQNVERIVQDFEEELNIAKDDMAALDHFMNKDAGPQRTLADIFRDKITEKRTEVETLKDDTSVKSVEVTPELQEMCAEVGKVLAKYRSGALPKMFKVIPKMRCWEELVYFTEPDQWSAAAMYQATRIFVSNLKEAMAQRFFNLVLLPRVRDDIATYRRLNYHLYQALCKALFKPAAFFKGFLLPLLLSGNCTLREAIIVGSVLARNSVPVLHSAAAILKIAEMDYSGPNSIFLRILFDKKYSLPYRVIDACVYHFIKFENDKRELPVLWHQAMLTFVQRYKTDLSSDQKDAMLEVIKKHGHYTITAEVRREIMNSKSRDDPRETVMAVN